MATNKRASRRSSGKRMRGPAARKKCELKAFSVLEWTFSREVLGVFLLVVGLFFTAAFLTGQGAFLGEVGLAATTRLLGLVGLTLPPLAVLLGFLVLLGRLPRGKALGATLLLLAGAVTLRGGLLGSGLYAAIHQVGGAVEAAFALSAFYAVGLSLLTGVSLGTAARMVGYYGVRSLYPKLRT